MEYLDLELPSDFSKVSNDIELFLSTRKQPIILDEAQRLPELFPVLRSIVDRNRHKAGQFVLLGSASYELVRSISESLSGRLAFLDLGPLLLSEVQGTFDFATHWLEGGFPEALLKGPGDRLNFEWFEFYTRTLIERDLHGLGVIWTLELSGNCGP